MARKNRRSKKQENQTVYLRRALGLAPAGEAKPPDIGVEDELVSELIPPGEFREEARPTAKELKQRKNRSQRQAREQQIESNYRSGAYRSE